MKRELDPTMTTTRLGTAMKSRAMATTMIMLTDSFIRSQNTPAARLMLRKTYITLTSLGHCGRRCGNQKETSSRCPRRKPHSVRRDRPRSGYLLDINSRPELDSLLTNVALFM